jgi:hypothetical protein
MRPPRTAVRYTAMHRTLHNGSLSTSQTVMCLRATCCVNNSIKALILTRIAFTLPTSSPPRGQMAGRDGLVEGSQQSDDGRAANLRLSRRAGNITGTSAVGGRDTPGQSAGPGAEEEPRLDSGMPMPRALSCHVFLVEWHLNALAFDVERSMLSSSVRQIGSSAEQFWTCFMP